MTKFKVKFKQDSGTRGSSSYVPAGFEVEVESNSLSTPHETEVRKAVEEKLGVKFGGSTSPGLWEAKRI
jgi:hypothetical protein